MIWEKHLKRWAEDLSFKLHKEIGGTKKIPDQALSGHLFEDLRQNVLNAFQKSCHRQDYKSLFFCLLSAGESLQVNKIKQK